MSWLFYFNSFATSFIAAYRHKSLHVTLHILVGFWRGPRWSKMWACKARWPLWHKSLIPFEVSANMLGQNWKGPRVTIKNRYVKGAIQWLVLETRYNGRPCALQRGPVKAKENLMFSEAWLRQMTGRRPMNDTALKSCWCPLCLTNRPDWNQGGLMAQRCLCETCCWIMCAQTGALKDRSHWGAKTYDS